MAATRRKHLMWYNVNNNNNMSIEENLTVLFLSIFSENNRPMVFPLFLFHTSGLSR